MGSVVTSLGFSSTCHSCAAAEAVAVCFLLFVVESLDVSVNVAALRPVLSLKCSILSCMNIP